MFGHALPRIRLIIYGKRSVNDSEKLKFHLNRTNNQIFVTFIVVGINYNLVFMR